MSDHLDIFDQFETKKEHNRPLFLSILCVFTWAGSWLTIMYYGLRILKVSEIEDSVFHQESYELEYLLLKIGTIAPVFSIIGAFFMWKLRRFGLFIYAVGQIAPALLTLYLTVLIHPIERPESYYLVGYSIAQMAFILLYVFNWRVMRW